MNEETNAPEVEEIVTDIAALAPEATLEDVIAKLNEVIEKVNDIKVRDRGPKSENAMTEELARKILMDEKISRLSHKKTAEILGLSYGQVSSVRGGYTFKKQYKEWRSKGSKKTWDRDYVEEKS